MSINLAKGQKISLSKEAPDLSDLMVGLGWSVNKKKNKRRGLFGGIEQDYDLDASVIMCVDDRFVSGDDLVYYGKKHHKSGSVWSTGDDLTGGAVGDCETVMIKLDKVPEKYNRLVVVVNIYQAHSRKQDFGQVENAFIRLVNQKTNKEIARYNLSENYEGMTAMIFGELYRRNGEWKFNAMGQARDVASINALCDEYK